MNASDAFNTKDFFYVTPGWNSFRMDSPLEPGLGYRSYVKMLPTKEPSMHTGDIYVFQGDQIVGMMGQIKFKRVPRSLMNQFFSPPDMRKKSSGVEIAPKPIASTPAQAVPVSKGTLAPHSAAVFQEPKAEALAEDLSLLNEKAPVPVSEGTISAAREAAAPAMTEVNSVIADCLELIASETGLEADELTEDAFFVELGVDSLMSLVLAEKFRNELRLEVKSSLFIQCPSIRDLKKWLEHHC